MVRIDLNTGECNMLVSEAELKKRRAELEAAGGYKIPESQTPWQEIFRKEVDQLSEGMVMKGATKFRRVAKVHPVPRDNH